ncbi:hypothetical protein [Aeromonas hydrophila]|uniref:hypothetical protein n=1 Tax=Aeromonas hydrophila TaxID=644 RepID=UPI00188FF34F|nr:hypothetical protein [Aeromonas hydrophila]MBF4801189.1 hypothetical protein [Aeromonas hydrophila]
MTTNKVEYFTKEEYKKITSWFDELGYRINPSRFQNVLDTIVDLPKEQHEAKDIWALCELDDLYRIYKAFHGVTNINSGFKDTLKKIIGGSVYLEDEPKSSSSENSRDFIFELLMGSAFAGNGIIPHFGVDTKTEADFKISLPDGTDIHAECKRIKSRNKIRKHTKKALNQAQERGENSDAGVIFVSISHLVWEILDRQLLCSKVQDIEQFIFNKAESLINEIQSYYNYAEFDKTVALITHYKLPFIDFDTNDILYFDKYHINLRYWEEHMYPPYNNDFRKRGIIAIHLPQWIK